MTMKKGIDMLQANPLPNCKWISILWCLWRPAKFGFKKFIK